MERAPDALAITGNRRTLVDRSESPEPKIGADEMLKRSTLAYLFLATAGIGGCASPGGQFVDHSGTALRQEGPASAAPSLFQQDGSGSRSMVGGFGPSQVIADVQGVSAASTLAQNTGTVRLPYDLNRDGVLGDGEIVVLNVSGNSDFAVQLVRFTYYDANNAPLSTVEVQGVSSVNSTIGPSVAPMVTEIARAYTAASADRRAEYDRYMETAQVAIREGRLAFSDALAMGLKILTGGATAVIP